MTRNRYRPKRRRELCPLDTMKFRDCISVMLEGTKYPSPPDDRPPLYFEDTGEVLQMTDSPLARMYGALMRRYPKMSEEESTSVWMRFHALMKTRHMPELAGYWKTEGDTVYTDGKLIGVIAAIPIEDWAKELTANEILQYMDDTVWLE